MWDYVDWVRSRIPRPTRQQNYAFAEFVSDAHSWYKKLPMEPPGEPFLVYLNPNVDRLLVAQKDGSAAKLRDFVDDPSSSTWLRSLKVDVRETDVEPNLLWGVDHYTRGRSTERRVRELGHWSFWNWGPPGEPADQAIERAHSRITVMDDDGESHPVSKDLLGLGLVYLRATVSPYMSFAEDEYEELRVERPGLPHAAVDRRAQLRNLVKVMKDIADAVFGPAARELHSV